MRKPRGLRAADEIPRIPDDDVPIAPQEPERAYGSAGRFRIPALDALRDAAPLSNREAKASRENLRNGLMKWFELFDDVIPMLARTHADTEIWQDMDDEELDSMTDALLDLGKRWRAPALVVRVVVRTYTYLEAGMITTERFKRTISYYVREGFALRLNLRFGK